MASEVAAASHRPSISVFKYSQVELLDGPLKVQFDQNRLMNLIVSTTKWTCKFPANEVLGWNTKYKAVLTDRKK